ncbi:hypothetical protein [Streptomyces sp. H39-S7]|uniref:hypothetical protein n=1 Tax=Streptomyces sp. H39-S7 TaxID=3004357 RepID=UPI0022AEEC03|nr:hypothetical protein [Streptomyces sp. H39-S7]MCZ4119043.1 hypothetical protein [Streptomyces sp. H39-S7]
MNIWDGTRWVPKAPKVYNFTTKQWAPAAPPLYFDNEEWMSEAPTPVEFPHYVDSLTSTFVGVDIVTCPIPSVRTNDFVVSVCAQQAGDSQSPRLLNPSGVIPTIYPLASGVRLHVAVWPWEPSKAGLVVWDVTGSANTSCMNLVYRNGDVSNASLNPVVSITGTNNTTAAPLPASQDYTNLYVALTVADTLTGNAWPDGVEELDSVFGKFGTKSLSLMAADTPGAGNSPGNLVLDTRVDTAVVALIQIPGKSDGLPTWILGDIKGSVLGTTTRLG